MKRSLAFIWKRYKLIILTISVLVVVTIVIFFVLWPRSAPPPVYP